MLFTGEEEDTFLCDGFCSFVIFLGNLLATVSVDLKESIKNNDKSNLDGTTCTTEFT